jgi:hypothetical protein
MAYFGILKAGAPGARGGPTVCGIQDIAPHKRADGRTTPALL